MSLTGDQAQGRAGQKNQNAAFCLHCFRAGVLPQVGNFCNPTVLGVTVWSEQWTPPPAPQALDVSLEGSRKLRLHHLSLTRCAVQRPSSWGRKYHENGKCGLAHDSVSLTCLFAVSALHTLLLPTPVWRRLKKLSLQSGGEAKKSFPSPESQAGEERDIGIDLVSALVPPQ